MPTVELSYEEVDSLISEISIGGKLLPIKTADSSITIIFLAHCTGLHKLRADFEYKQAYNKAIEEGFLTSEETRSILLSKGILEEVDSNEISKLETKIKAQELYVSKLTRVPSRREEAIKNLNRMKDDLSALLYKKEEGLDFSAEKIAFEQKYLYMTWCGTRDPFTKDLYWPTKKEFDSERDLVFRRAVFLETIKLSGGTGVSTIRYLARSNIWRIRYLASVKTGESLFGIPVYEYSTDQLSLSYWSQYYQSVYEMLPDDKPPDDIIEDDAALDAYMKSYFDNLNREATSARESKQKGKGVKSAWEHGETLVMKSNPLYEDIEYSETVESIRNKNKIDLKPKNPFSKK